jgi:hypothetical protein
VNLNHLASLELIRKIRRSRLLSPSQVRTGEPDTRGYNEEAYGAERHGENVRPVSGTSTYACTMNGLKARAPLARCVTRLAGHFWKSFGADAKKGGGASRLRVPLELGCEGRNVRGTVSLVMLLVTTTDITVWVVSALLALGIGAGKYAKWKARNQFVRELAAMDRERREKVLSRMNPAQAMEARQELMRRFNIF